jgi:hypothetical protein
MSFTITVRIDIVDILIINIAVVIVAVTAFVGDVRIDRRSG